MVGEKRIREMLALVEQLHPGDDEREFSVSVTEARLMLAAHELAEAHCAWFDDDADTDAEDRRDAAEDAYRAVRKTAEER